MVDRAFRIVSSLFQSARQAWAQRTRIAKVITPSQPCALGNGKSQGRDRVLKTVPEALATKTGSCKTVLGLGAADHPDLMHNVSLGMGAPTGVGLSCFRCPYGCRAFKKPRERRFELRNRLFLRCVTSRILICYEAVMIDEEAVLSRILFWLKLTATAGWILLEKLPRTKAGNIPTFV
jgi:hypothetical protein